jgi:hypothetical protein
MEEPTGPMRKEAASAGFYKSPWGKPKAEAPVMKGRPLDFDGAGDAAEDDPD